MSKYKYIKASKVWLKLLTLSKVEHAIIKSDYNGQYKNKIFLNLFILLL